MLEEPGKRGAQVVVVALEPVDPARIDIGDAAARPVGDGGKPARVALDQCRRLPASAQPYRRVLAHWLELAVAIRVTRVVDADQGFVDEAREHLEHVVLREAVAGADGLGGLELEPAGEDREAAEECTLAVVEQVVAPVERALQRLLAGKATCPGGAEYREPLPQTLGDLGRRQRRRARS